MSGPVRLNSKARRVLDGVDRLPGDGRSNWLESGAGPAFPTKSEGTYLLLRDQIIRGALISGAAIAQEQLAQLLHISTTPLREALRRLEGEGLLTITAHKEVLVAPMSVRDLEGLYEVRLTLDALAARLAAERASPAQRARMLALIDGAAWEAPIIRLEMNRKIHRSIYSSCGNDVLVGQLEVLWDRADRYRYLLLEHEDQLVASAASEHGRLLRVVAGRDADEAERLTRKHLLSSLRRLRQRLRSQLPEGNSDRPLPRTSL